MNNIYNLALACCGVVILLLCWRLDSAEDQIQAFEQAQAVAENNALQQQRETEQHWQAKLESAEDEHQAHLQDLERRYDDALHSLDSVQQSATNSERAALPDSAAPSCIVKQSDANKRFRSRLADCEVQLLNFAKERDECAVKFNSILKMYQAVSKK